MNQSPALSQWPGGMHIFYQGKQFWRTCAAYQTYLQQLVNGCYKHLFFFWKVQILIQTPKINFTNKHTDIEVFKNYWFVILHVLTLMLGISICCRDQNQMSQNIHLHKLSVCTYQCQTYFCLHIFVYIIFVYSIWDDSYNRYTVDKMEIFIHLDSNKNAFSTVFPLQEFGNVLHLLWSI